ncbi:glycosyltransferase family 2 protein [Aminiphilus circumscriptus]|uniref:glycosyltransferase family 2 protein n=1 Tax=Aminiphilus circumscriptus TaxID=290732 RepID=UPI0004BA605A|nr:glycosyltransferase family 2 protein [Aminiphilus circumscriptus]
MTPLLSVVLPLFNKKPFVERTIASVLAQTERCFSLIVVDDGSTDGGADVVERIEDERIRLLRLRHGGVSKARNAGVRAAETELVAFLDGDDEWDPDHLETLLRLRRRFPEAVLYATAYRFVLPGQRVCFPRLAGVPSFPWEGVLSRYFRSAALGHPPVWTSAAAVVRTALQGVGGFPEDFSLGEDLDTWGRLALAGSVAFSRRGLATYHKDATDRLCLRLRRDKPLPFVETARNVLEEARCDEVLERDLRAYRGRLLSLSCRELLRQGRIDEARNLLSGCGRLPYLVPHVVVSRLLCGVAPVGTFFRRR